MFMIYDLTILGCYTLRSPPRSLLRFFTVRLNTFCARRGLDQLLDVHPTRALFLFEPGHTCVLVTPWVIQLPLNDLVEYHGCPWPGFATKHSGDFGSLPRA